MKKSVLILGAIALLSINMQATTSVSINTEMAVAPSTTHAMFKVKGNCETCKARIEKAALSVKGVKTASWDVKTGMLHLNFDSKMTSERAVSKAVARVGHDTQFDKADNKVYNALPGCCKYKR